MRKEGKPGPFIPSEVRAQMGPARATTPVPARWRRWATRAVGAWAKRPRLGDDVYARAETPAPAQKTHVRRRQRMRPGDKVCARAMTGGAWEGCFSQTPQTSALLRRRLRPGDNACVRATAPASGRRRPHARRR